MDKSALEGVASVKGSALIFKVKVQPRSARDAVVGLLGDAVKVALTAPPVDGKANAALAKFLSKALGVSKGSIHILAGQTGRDKLLSCEGATPEALAALLPE